MRNSLIYLICSIFITSSAYADDLQLCGNLQQGELIVGHIKPTDGVKINGTVYPVNTQTGEFVFALSRDEKSPLMIEITDESDAQKVYQIPIKESSWKIQNIKGIAQQKVTPKPEDEAEILRERHDVKQALSSADMSLPYWNSEFIIPVKGIISGHFGNQRIFNGTPKNPHNGIDIAAPKGMPVKASADGKVLLSGGNYFYSGNMVILDHGHGVQTIYAHLQKAQVKVGDIVKQGEVIGLVGSTGRSTGPHLHWGASVNNIRFRPHSLVEKNTDECRIIKPQEKI